ncbi:MAG: amidohydrolase [Chitinophagaceae bacterium]|nr:MAG: amidohydrolase [Chitinophagaceae bacterium]
MMYRKFKAEALFTGDRFLTGGEVLITDKDGRVVEIVDGSAISDAELFAGTICPGFINTHCHLELSWMKGIVPKHSGMIDFLFAVMQTKPAEGQEVKKAMYVAEAQMVRTGIVAVGDICNTSVTIDIKKDRLLYYHNFIETMGFADSSAPDRFMKAVQVFNDFATLYPLPVASNSIVPHAPYSVSKTLFDLITRFPGNRLLSIHNQENSAENEFFLEGSGDFHRLFNAIGVDSSAHKATGKTSLQHYLPWVLRNQTIILVHNTETGSKDLQYINSFAAKGVSTWMCLCPNANLYINNKLPDIRLISENTDRITLGTDSLASNDKLDLLEEIKTIYDAYPEIDIQRLLKWGTMNGAKALDIDDEVGSFAPGKQPGIVHIEGLTPSGISKSAKSKRIL